MSDRRGRRAAARLWCPTDVPGVELLDATYGRHVLARYAPDEFALGVVERGAARVACAGAMHVAPAGRVLLCNPGEVHLARPAADDRWRVRVLYLEASLLDRLAGGRIGALRPHFAPPLVEDARAAALLRAVHDTFARAAPRSECERTLASAIRYVLDRHAAPEVAVAGSGRGGAERRAVRRAREFLERHAAEQVSLHALARVAGLSAYHLAHVFRAEVGVPPHRYLEHARVRRAKALLRAGLPIAQVALEAGFVDQSHFTRRFRLFAGVTPTQYRFGRQDRKPVPNDPRPPR